MNSYKLSGYRHNMSYNAATGMVRTMTCGRERLLEATQEGLLDPQTVVEMCARWMTSDDIYEMCTANEVNLARICGD